MKRERDLPVEIEPIDESIKRLFLKVSAFLKCIKCELQQLRVKCLTEQSFSRTVYRFAGQYQAHCGRQTLDTESKYRVLIRRQTKIDCEVRIQGYTE